MSTTRDPATPPSDRWSVGGVFLEALTARDYRKMASTFSGDVRFRAMLLPGPMDWNGPDEVAAVFTSWFGDAEEFELIDATVGEVGGRLHLSWRLRVRPAPFGIGGGWHVIDSRSYVDADETIDSVDLLARASDLTAAASTPDGASAVMVPRCSGRHRRRRTRCPRGRSSATTWSRARCMVLR